MDKKFLKLIFVLAIPIALQNMTTAFMSIMDIIIIEKLGDTILASVSLANQIAFVESLIVFGLCSGASVFISQSYGEKNFEKMNQVFKISFSLVIGVTVIIFLLGLMAPKEIMKLFTNDSKLIENGSLYIRIVSPTYVLIGISTMSMILFRCIRIAQYPLYAGIITLITKTLLNYTLINGLFGIEPMGISGAAYGRMGETTVTAMNICMNLEELFNSFFYGIGGAALVIIGNEIGRDRTEQAKKTADKFIFISLLTGVIVMITMMLIKNSFVNGCFPNISLYSREIAGKAIFITAFFMPFRSVGCISNLGTLRSGGDTLAAMLNDTIPLYVLSIPVAFILGVWLKQPIYFILPLIYLDKIVKCILNLSRQISGKWNRRVI